jgi:hypothetical protein
MKRAAFMTIAIAVAIATTLVTLWAQSDRQQRVAFKPGASSATLGGSITGDETVDYVLGARRGQTMRVTLTTSNDSSYFNVLPPGSAAAIAIGPLSATNGWARCQSTATIRFVSTSCQTPPGARKRRRLH